MKIKQSIGLLAMGIAFVTYTSAQTTPTGTINPTTYPQGAIALDSMSSKQMTRSQKRAMKRNRKSERTDASETINTSVQNARYKESSTSGGTAINNSNVTNYNSNNATNAPTGVGSNPNTATTLKNETVQNSNPNPTKEREATSNAGAVEAIKGAKSTEMPAVKSGSTVRNTSVGDFMASSPNYVTLQNTLQSVNLVDVLKGTGPFTLFAPDNDAFKKLPTAVLGGLLDGSNRDALKQLLSYHVVSGLLTPEEMTRQIRAGNGTAQLKTLAGSALTAKLGSSVGQITLTDEQGNTVQLDDADTYRQANGLVYGIKSVLIPKSGLAAFK